MKIIIQWMLVLLFLVHSSNVAHAQQSSFPILAMDVRVTPIDNDTASNGLPDISDTTIFRGVMNVQLFDTTGIDRLEVKLVSTPGGGDLLSQNFVFDVSGALGNGTSYHRNGFEISLGLGDFAGLLNYSAEVKIKKVDGSYTSSVSFTR